MGFHLIRKNPLLRLVAMLEEFLDDVIAKDISHELQAVGLNLAEDLVFLIAVGGLEFLLDEPRSMLITTEFHNVVVDILELC